MALNGCAGCGAEVRPICTNDSLPETPPKRGVSAAISAHFSTAVLVGPEASTCTPAGAPCSDRFRSCRCCVCVTLGEPQETLGLSTPFLGSSRRLSKD
ncbi:hypothetical protein VTI28DRAFT_9610 [Corynascus sepedonium]